MAVKPEQAPSLITSLQSEVASEASPMLTFLINHARTIALGIVLFIVAIGGYWFYSRSAGEKRLAEQQNFGRILVIKKAEDRLKALEEYLKIASAPLTSAAWFAVADTARELKDYPKVYEAWGRIAVIDPSIKVTAVLAMAEAQMEEGKHKEALATLEGIAGGLAPADVVNVNGRIAVLAENLGDYARAVAACEAILANPAAAGDTAFWTQKVASLKQKAVAAK